MPRRGQTDEQTDEQSTGYGEQDESFNFEQPGDGTEQPGDGEQASPDGEQATPETDEEKAARLEAEAEALRAEIAAIEGFSEISPELQEEITPKRKRNDRQRAFDIVAARAYQAWIDRDRPTVWSKLPVITYYLDPEVVADWKSKIRKACEFVTPQGEASGVRVRFGADEFTLTEEKAAKIGRPDDAGKTVVSWAAVDKRKNSRTNGDTPATPDADDDDDE